MPDIACWRRWLVQWDVTHFAIALAASAFATMWKIVCTHFTMLTVPRTLPVFLWFGAVVTLLIVTTIYVARIKLWPASILFDFRNPKMVNFFFAPVIIGCLLTLGAPPATTSYVGHKAALFTLGAYQMGLSIYLSGEWLFGSVLIDVAHPVVFMQVIGYFLLGILASELFFVELAIAFASVGSLFWMLIFVTNFQHTSIGLSRRSEEPSPTFFLFIAPPSQAAIALFLLGTVIERESPIPSSTRLLQFPVNTEWNILAKSVLYIALFIYALMFRLFPTFWTQNFAITWWAYIFPLSAAASATVLRANSASHGLFWAVLSRFLVSIATIAMITVLIATVWGMKVGRLPQNANALNAYCECIQQRSKSKLKNNSRYGSINSSEFSM